jgi:MOSC domain-containing protein YiiM
VGVLVSVNVGEPRPVTWTRARRTSIAKTAVAGPVDVGPLGLAGDDVSNKRHHGGPDRAVYAFAREDLDRWAEVFGRPVPDGMFGENLTTRGVDVNGALLGERWRIGAEVVVEVATFRTPCRTFTTWLNRNGYDARGWARRFAEDGRPGAYLRVVVPGRVEVGDPVVVVDRPGVGLTVGESFRDAMRSS